MELRPVRVLVEGESEGRIVFVDGGLVAVLVRLSSLHEHAADRWFLEAGLGPLNSYDHPIFADLEQARSWISERMGAAT